jgi:hypothetical protein
MLLRVHTSLEKNISLFYKKLKSTIRLGTCLFIYAGEFIFFYCAFVFQSKEKKIGLKCLFKMVLKMGKEKKEKEKPLTSLYLARRPGSLGPPHPLSLSFRPTSLPSQPLAHQIPRPSTTFPLRLP